MCVFYLFQLKEANTNPDMEMNISTHCPILPAIYPNQSPPIGICLCLLILLFVYPSYKVWGGILIAQKEALHYSRLNIREDYL